MMERSNTVFQKRLRRLLPLLALLALLTLAGCDSKGDQDGSSSANPAADANDPVAQAHKRGRDWAELNNAKLVTDCGALADADERFGCADYINHLGDQPDQ